MRFWQVFESRNLVPEKIFGQSVPNWQTDHDAADYGLKLMLQGDGGSASVHLNFDGIAYAEVNNKFDMSGSLAEIEDKLTQLGIIKFVGYDKD